MFRHYTPRASKALFSKYKPSYQAASMTTLSDGKNFLKHTMELIVTPGIDRLAPNEVENVASKLGSIHQFKFKDINNVEIPLSQYEGTLLLITNTACECGYTKRMLPQLQEWKDYLISKGVKAEVLAFSSNSFKQENRSNEQIKEFISSNFPKLNYHIMAPSEVVGANKNPVYKYLTDVFPGDPTWNFSSVYIVNPKGIPVRKMTKGTYDKMINELDHIVSEQI